MWAEPRPANPPPRVWRDWALVAVLLPSTVLEITLRDATGWEPATAVFFVALVAALLRRRTNPLAAVAVTFGVMTAVSAATLLGAGEPTVLYSMAWVLVLPYALFRWGAGREAVTGLAVMLASVALGIVVDFTGVLDSVVGIAILLLPAALGASIRYRANARIREIDQVKLLEREQLARELHDTVAHHVSGIAVQAQAGRTLAETHPERALQALEVIEEAASRTLAEMRTMVGVLRDGEAATLAPQPGVADIERLARHAGNGLPIDVELSDDLDDLGSAVDSAVYRLAQESITNAARHARHATRISVRVAGDDDSVRLTVHDDGDTPAAGRDTWGYGLVGMTERATLLGGSLRAGPDPDSGWTVEAVLPRTGSAS
jgi:signal transduction histidine kinase